MEMVIRKERMSNSTIQEAADLYFNSDVEYIFDENGNFRRAVGFFGTTIEATNDSIVLKASEREIPWLLSALAGVALISQVKDEVFWDDVNNYIRVLRTDS